MEDKLSERQLLVREFLTLETRLNAVAEKVGRKFKVGCYDNNGNYIRGRGGWMPYRYVSELLEKINQRGISVTIIEIQEWLREAEEFLDSIEEIIFDNFYPHSRDRAVSRTELVPFRPDDIKESDDMLGQDIKIIKFHLDKAKRLGFLELEAEKK
jgi:hypothetical protein